MLFSNIEMDHFNQIFDEILRNKGDCIEVDQSIFISIKHLKPKYLNVIYSLIVCYFILDCTSQMYDPLQILSYLQIQPPYGGAFIDNKTKKGIKIELGNLPLRLQSILTYYLKNYFLS